MALQYRRCWETLHDGINAGETRREGKTSHNPYKVSHSVPIDSDIVALEDERKRRALSFHFYLAERLIALSSPRTRSMATRRNTTSTAANTHYDRYVSNGRLVSQSERPVRFSVGRFVALFIVTASLLLTNPANAPFTWDALYRNHVEPHVDFFGLPTTASADLSGRVTNYGFFCVKDQPFLGLEFHGAGFQLFCPYYNKETLNFLDNTDTIVMCRALQADMAHQKPFLIDSTDRAYTTHRLFALVFLLAGSVAFCIKSPKGILTGRRPLLDGLLIIFIPVDSNWAIVTALANIVQSNLFLFPVWKRMDTLIAWQHPQSIFRVADNDNDLNYACSVVTLVFLAALCNVLMKRITGRYLLRGYDSLQAVALGYFRGSTMATGTLTTVWFPLLSHWNTTVDWVAVQWTALAVVWMGGPWFSLSILGWIGANFVGGVLGEYQYQNQFLLTIGRQIWHPIENVLNTFFGANY